MDSMFKPSEFVFEEQQEDHNSSSEELDDNITADCSNLEEVKEGGNSEDD